MPETLSTANTAAAIHKRTLVTTPRWNALDQTAVDAPSINAFKQILVKVKNNRMGFFMD